MIVAKKLLHLMNVFGAFFSLLLFPKKHNAKLLYYCKLPKSLFTYLKMCPSCITLRSCLVFSKMLSTLVIQLDIEYGGEKKSVYLCINKTAKQRINEILVMYNVQWIPNFPAHVVYFSLVIRCILYSINVSLSIWFAVWFLCQLQSNTLFFICK